MQNIHRIDNQSRIGRIFPGGISILLYGGYRIFQQNSFPTVELRTGEIAVNPLVISSRIPLILEDATLSASISTAKF